jgi:glycosyltransferase involved in cell wall biosynthesis
MTYFIKGCHSEGPQAQRNLLVACSAVTARDYKVVRASTPVMNLGGQPAKCSALAPVRRAECESPARQCRGGLGTESRVPFRDAIGRFSKMTTDINPVVSLIVPARNEEANLAACLESLVAQTGIVLEIIVVDDDSTDRTAEIARSFASPERYGLALGEIKQEVRQCGREQDDHEREGTASAVPKSSHFDDRGFSPAVRVIPAGPLPANWTGKNNAMSAGAKIAKGKWLLFTDADTAHAPGSLACAVAEAEQHGAALLSYSPAQEVHGFWEKAVMPVIFAELATTYPPQAVNDPTSPIAAANGQYLMISREAYDAVGGHTTIAADLLEDVALARLVKCTGRKIFFRYGGDAVRTRMYHSFAQLREGWTKNLALLFPRPRTLALLRTAEFLLIVGNLSTAIWAKLSGRPNLALQTALLTGILSGWFAMRIRKAHFSVGSSLIAVFGLPIFSYLLLRSASLHGNTGVVWKGRGYSASRPANIS